MDFDLTNPLLSVVIPTWNRAYIVCEAIESAFKQSPGKIEVIVVDDGSTDNTAEVIERSFGSRVRLLRLPVRRGAGAARNAGISVATGQLLAFLDSDDLWLPGKLDAELRVFEQFPDADAVISDSLGFTDQGAEDCSRFARNNLVKTSGGKTRWMSECKWLWTNSQNGVATCSITLRRDALVRFDHSYFPEDVDRCEDWEFEISVYRFCRVVVLPEVWSWIRRSTDGLSLDRRRIGNSDNLDNELGLLRDRLTVMERSHWLSGLRSELAAEFERFRKETADKLAEQDGASHPRPVTSPARIS